jgi:hypothetical protein
MEMIFETFGAPRLRYRSSTQTPLKRGVAGRNPVAVFGPCALHLKNESSNEFEEICVSDKLIQAMKFACRPAANRLPADDFYRN